MPDPAAPRRTPHEPDDRPGAGGVSRRFDAIICDIDGCLGPESNEPLDLASLARIAAHNLAAETRRDRPVLTVCSGRPQPFAEAMCRIVRNTTLPAVCENGVWLFDPAQNRYLRDPAITPAHMHAVHEAAEWIERELAPRGVVMQPGKTASISLWHPDTDYLRSVMPTLRDVFVRSGWPFRVSMTVAWINCDLEHVSKSTGLARAVELARLTPARLVGVGDSPSDLAMLDHVAFFACPSNAAPEVKARSHYISPHAEIAGVLDIITRVSAPA